MNRLAKFTALPLRRKSLVLRCWCELNLMALALRMTSLPRILAFMGTNSPTAALSSQITREEIVWSVRAASRLSWHSTCAVRALVAERLLRRQGYRVQFKVGVSRADDFQAHAWVEDESGILVGESEQPYHSLPDLSPRNVVTPS